MGLPPKVAQGLHRSPFTKTVSAGNERLLIVGVTVQDKNITSVAFSGTTMTQFALGTRNSMRVGLYYLALGSSTAATTASVVVGIAASSDAFAGAADYSGVYQAAPFVNPTIAQAKSTTPSVTFTSAVGHKAVSLLGDIAATPTSNGSGQTQYWTFTGSHSSRATEKAGAASVTMSHTLSANEDWVMIGGTMQDNSVILPIELKEFKAEKISTRLVNLTWRTASEKSNDYFLIERSHKGKGWEEVTRIKSKGNSNLEQKYDYKDELDNYYAALHNETSHMYYRLSQIDFNGDKKVFEIVEAVPYAEGVNEITVYPNPSEAESINVHIDLTFFAEESTLRIIDCTGRVAFEQQVKLNQGDNDLQLSLPLPKGIYCIEMATLSGVLSHKKLIIR